MSGLESFTLNPEIVANDIEHLKGEIGRSVGNETYLRKQLKWDDLHSETEKQLLVTHKKYRGTRRGFSQLLTDIGLKEHVVTPSYKSQFDAVSKTLFGGTQNAAALRCLAVAFIQLVMWALR